MNLIKIAGVPESVTNSCSLELRNNSSFEKFSQIAVIMMLRSIFAVNPLFRKSTREGISFPRIIVDGRYFIMNFLLVLTIALIHKGEVIPIVNGWESIRNTSIITRWYTMISGALDVQCHEVI